MSYLPPIEVHYVKAENLFCLLPRKEVKDLDDLPINSYDKLDFCTLQSVQNKNFNEYNYFIESFNALVKSNLKDKNDFQFCTITKLWRKVSTSFTYSLYSQELSNLENKLFKKPEEMKFATSREVIEFKRVSFLSYALNKKLRALVDDLKQIAKVNPSVAKGEIPEKLSDLPKYLKRFELGNKFVKMERKAMEIRGTKHGFLLPDQFITLKTVYKIYSSQLSKLIDVFLDVFELLKDLTVLLKRKKFSTSSKIYVATPTKRNCLRLGRMSSLKAWTWRRWEVVTG